MVGYDNAGGSVLVTAVADGWIVTAGLAASVVTDSKTGAKMSGAEPSKSKGKYGIAFAGDASVNVMLDDTEAYVRNDTVTGPGSLEANGRTDDGIISVAGSAALSTKDSKSAGIAGSVVVNVVHGGTWAFIDNSTVNVAGDLSVTALTEGSVLGIAASGSAATQGVGIAGSVVVNVVDRDTYAYVLDTDVQSAFGVAVSGADTSKLTAVAGAISYGGKAGIGASAAVNVMNDKAEAYIEDSDVTTTGDVAVTANSDTDKNSITQTFAASDADGTKNVINQATGLGTGDAVVYDNGGGTSIGGLTQGATYYVTKIDGGTFALAASNDQATAEMTFDTSSAGVNSTAKTVTFLNKHGLTTGDAVMYTSTGADNIGLIHKQVYYAIVLDDYTIQLAATKDDALDGINALALTPTGGLYFGRFLYWDNFLALDPSQGTGMNHRLRVRNDDVIGAAAAIGLSTGRMGVGFAASVNVIDNETQAYIKGRQSGGINANGNVTVSATDEPGILGIAGALGAAKNAGVGVALLANSISNDTLAYIDSSLVSTGGASVHVAGRSDATILGVAVGGAAADSVGVAGSIAVSYVGNTTKAYIVGSSTTVSADDDVTVSADADKDITTATGNLSGAGKVAVMAGIATLVTTCTTEAYVGPNVTIVSQGSGSGSSIYTGVLTAGGDRATEVVHGAAVSATSHNNVVTVAVGGALAGNQPAVFQAAMGPVIEEMRAKAAADIAADRRSRAGEPGPVRVCRCDLGSSPW